ncbi:hypothetical protein BGZ65_012551 [Modicella reniformis]|uniref:Uncharacterized protein n=1 Tax=Modicella reniformis TaxID=1440133 RepID=A0A9P6IMK2_9FUNG|nr:hypothetical protein BGZ65_012551 [Modicella reniformis]
MITDSVFAKGEVCSSSDERDSHPVRSQNEHRKMKNFLKTPVEDEDEDEDEPDMTSDAIKQYLDKIEATLKDEESRKDLKARLRCQSSASQNVRRRERNSYTKLRQARRSVRELRRVLIPREESLRQLRKQRYRLNNQLKAVTSKKKTSADKNEDAIKFTKPT